MEITITQLESAINYWRARKPSTGEECALCAEAAALAGPYAEMIMHRRQAADDAAWPEPARAALAAALAPLRGGGRGEGA